MGYFLLALQFLPAVLQAILAVEKSIGSALPGSSKKAIVLGAVVAAASVGETVPVQNVAVVSTLIDKVVGELNASGLFSKGTVAPLPAAPVVAAATAPAIQPPAPIPAAPNK